MRIVFFLRLSLGGLATGLACACSLSAHALEVQQPAPVIDLPVSSVRSAAGFGSVLNAVELKNGQLVVNDAATRQLVVLDRSLKQMKVVLDSASALPAYGADATPLVLCSCQEAWFPGQTSKSILAFTSGDASPRVMAAPRAQDFRNFMLARSVADTLGNLYYVDVPISAAVRRGGGIQAGSPHRDSTFLYRVNFNSRQLQLIGSVRTKHRPWKYSGVRDGSALPPLHTILDILPPLDEWAVTSDGTLAIVRGHDNHVDWLLPNGEVVHSPKLPFAFKRLTDADKIALRDSATISELAEDKARAEALVECIRVWPLRPCPLQGECLAVHAELLSSGQGHADSLSDSVAAISHSNYPRIARLALIDHDCAQDSELPGTWLFETAECWTLA